MKKRKFELLVEAKIVKYNKKYKGLFSYWNKAYMIYRSKFFFWKITIETENDQFFEMDFIAESNLQFYTHGKWDYQKFFLHTEIDVYSKFCCQIIFKNSLESKVINSKFSKYNNPALIFWRL